MRRPAIARLLDPLPADLVPSLDARRTPPGQPPPQVPSARHLMVRLGAGFPEPGWTVLAYSLLSQLTHATPLGLLHTIGGVVGGETAMSPEMTALVIDAVCMGAAVALPSPAAVFSMNAGLGPVDDWAYELRRASYGIHDVARRVHFLD